MRLKYPCFRLEVGRDSDLLWTGRFGDRMPLGARFPHTSMPVLGPSQPPLQCITCLFPRSKAVGALRWPPTPSSAEVIEIVELYLYSTSGLSWSVLGLTLNFTFTVKHITLMPYIHHWAPHNKSFNNTLSTSLTKNLHVANVLMFHNTSVLKVSNDGFGVL